MAILDKNFCYIKVSQQWLLDYHLAGCVEDIIGKHVKTPLCGTPIQWPTMYARCLAGESVHCEEDYFSCIDDDTCSYVEPRWLRWSAHPWYEDEQIKGIILFSIDITQQKRTQHEMEEANNAKSRFLANMSHEIRTPLNGIIGTANLLTDAHLPLRERGYMSIILESSQTLLKLINDILDISKIEAGKIELHKETLNIKAFHRGIINLFTANAMEKNLELRLECDASLPANVIMDGQRVRQILSNLIHNALKFTERGNVTVSVTSSSEDIRWQVRDTGIGITPDKLALLFETFSQAHNPHDYKEYGGTGLRLAISKALVDMMGGSIGVESRLNIGTTFWFSLPLQAPKMATVMPSPLRHLSTLFNGHALIAEDMAANRLIIGDTLEKYGISMDMAENGVIAEQYAKSRSYDLIFMDIRMPEQDGIETTRRLIAFAAEHNLSFPPIIGLTAYAVEEAKAECMKAGMVDVLTKPIDREALQACLEKWLLPMECAVTVPTNTALCDAVIPNSVKANVLQHLAPERATLYAKAALNDFKTRLQGMQTATRNQKWLILAEHAHALKSVAVDINALACSQYAKEIENLCRCDSAVDAAMIKAQVDNLTKEINSLIPTLQAVASGATAS